MCVEGSKRIEFFFLNIIEVKLLSAKKNCYNYKIFYVSPMVAINKMPIGDSQKKMRKESKDVTTKNNGT